MWWQIHLPEGNEERPAEATGSDREKVRHTSCCALRKLTSFKVGTEGNPQVWGNLRYVQNRGTFKMGRLWVTSAKSGLEN